MVAEVMMSFQIAALRQQCRQIAEQKVDVKTALMRLVDDDRIVSGEFRIALDLGENTVGTTLNRVLGELSSVKRT